jgi:hypothetical protein
MDYSLVIGIIVVVVVGFFAYQWVSKRPASAPTVMRKRNPIPIAPPEAAPMAKEEQGQGQRQGQEQGQGQLQYPEIAGQTQQESLAKEPLQRRVPSSEQGPVMNNGSAPAQFDEHLRHPEQSFHQAAPPSNPQMLISEVNAGRAGHQSAPLGGNQQQFSPELAQNGGALLGNSVFAYDGMEPTGFTAF